METDGMEVNACNGNPGNERMFNLFLYLFYMAEIFK